MNTADVPTPSFVFAGEVAANYEEFLGPMFFEPYAIEVASRIDPASIRLAVEIASGTGRVTRHLRERIPASAKLIASDISEDMLSIAKKKLKDFDIEWKIIDAQSLPFDDNSADLVVCCFAYMLVPDRAKALAEAHRILRPGGMLLFTTWDKLELNAASHIYRKIAKKYLGDVLSEAYNLPFSLYDDTLIRSLLQDAGFSKIAIGHVIKSSFCRTAKEAVNGLAQGGMIYNEIMKRNPAWMDEIKDMAEKELSEKFGAEPMIAPMSALISQAWK